MTHAKRNVNSKSRRRVPTEAARTSS